jgi:hypothetical protein
MTDIGIPHPVEREAKDRIERVIDELRGRITWAQMIGVLDLIKMDLHDEIMLSMENNDE